MTKRKHPTIETLRQGQTVYLVVDEIWRHQRPVPKTITEWYLYSKNEPLPSEGSIIYRMPVTLMKKIIDIPGNGSRSLYYSRKKAESADK